MNITVQISDTPPTPKPEPPEAYRVLTVPDDGNTYMLLLDDWDMAQWQFKPRSQHKNYKIDPPWNALPATVQTQKLFFALNKEWQLFYFELIRRANGYSLSIDMMLEGYRKSMRDSGGWRDQHTFNNWRNDRDKIPHDQQKIFTDYVLGLNIPPAHTYGDAAQQDLLSSGNIVKVIGTINNDYVIEALNPFLPTPSVEEVWGKWWLVGFATSSGYNWDTGARARLKWAYFGGYGMPHMTLGRDGKSRVAKTWCKPIENGAQYSLYV